MAESPTTDQLFVRLLVEEEGSVWKMDDYGVDREHLSQEAREACEFVDDYQSENRMEPPSQPVIVHEMGWPEVRLEEVDVDLDYLAREIRVRATDLAIRQILDEVDRLRQGGKEGVFDARDALVEFVDEELRGIARTGDRASEVFDLYPEVARQYERIKQGEVAIPTLWPTATDAIRGWELGDVTFWLGRPGVGKTFMLLRYGIDLWEKGLRILFVSPELDELQVAQRHACLQTGTSYTKYSDGELGDIGEVDFLESLRDLQDSTGFLVLEEDMGISRDAVETMVGRYDPDALLLDSVHLYGEGRDRGKSIEDAMPWVARISSWGRERLVMCSSQLNRDAEDAGLDEINSSMIFGADAIYQDSDTIYAMRQEPEMAADNEMGVTPIKVRHGVMHDSFLINWDLDRMQFDEVVIEEYDRGGDSADGDDDLGY